MQQIMTAHGLLDERLLFVDTQTVDNANEHTVSKEYRLRNPLRMVDGRIVKAEQLVRRDAHVQLKAWPEFAAEVAIGSFLKSLFESKGRGITPTGTQPDQVNKRALRFLGRGFRFANSQAMCTSFKQELLNGSHAFGTQGGNAVRTVTTKDTFKMALYLASGSLGAATTVYSSTSELAGTGNYTQTGNSVTNATVPTTSGTTAYWTPSASVSWANLTSSGSFDASLLYNDASSSKLAVAVFTFGAQSITAGTFTLTMPTNDASNALIRIA